LSEGTVTADIFTVTKSITAHSSKLNGAEPKSGDATELPISKLQARTTNTFNVAVSKLYTITVRLTVVVVLFGFYAAILLQV